LLTGFLVNASILIRGFKKQLPAGYLVREF
jgi:hypothetical protein